MEQRTLGKDLRVSAVGLGCMGFTHAYGTACDSKEAARAIRQAVGMGYTFFDTAECYTGTDAKGDTAYNEELVGEALKPCRDNIVLASKCGVRHLGNRLEMDSRPGTIRKSLEGSLKKLQTDRIDLYYQHRIDPKVSPEEVAGTMGELIREGKILHWGVSDADEAYIRRANAVCPLTAVQNRLSMMYRDDEALFPVLEELQIGYVAFSPLANGFLSDSFCKGEQFESGDFRGFMPQYSDEGYNANQELLSLLRNLAGEKKVTPAQISLAWMLGKKPYIVPIPGSRKVERIRENAGAADVLLTAEEVERIDNALQNTKMSPVFSGHRS